MGPRPSRPSGARSPAAAEAGLPYAPYAFESRWHLVFQYVVRGQLGRRARPRRGGRVAAEDPAGGASTCSCSSVAAARAAVDVGDRLPALRRLWADEGLIAIHSSPMEMVEAVRARRPRRACSRAYDDAVAILSRLWQPWFPARIRLAATAIGALADAAPVGRRPTSRPALARPGRGAARPTARWCSSGTRPGRALGSGGRAWNPRLDAEAAAAALAGRRRRPTTTCWSRRGARPRMRCRGVRRRPPAGASSGSVLATILRAAGDTAAAREVADLAREAAHGARRAAAARPAHRAGLASEPGSRPAATRSPPARPRSSPWSPRAAPTARSASSCSSPPRRCRSTSPTSSASSAPPVAPRRPRSRVGAACSS